MKPFKKENAFAAAIKIANIDTDMLIPKQFLKITVREGLGRYLFNDLRYNSDGTEKKDFTLNTMPYKHAGFLLAYENFACGSSREHAVWALTDFGFRAVIAPSFADIFFNNASKNGLLLIRLEKEKIDKLMEDNKEKITIDLAEQHIISAKHNFSFDIDHTLKNKLLNGWDDIETTLQHKAEIEKFEQESKKNFPWR